MASQIGSVKGTKDFYPEDMAIRTWLYSKVRCVSELFGYQEYEAPILETLNLYAAKTSEELVKEQTFVFPDKGGNTLALRPELTPSLARMVAKRQAQLTFPLRWWSFGPMWRYERPQKGRTREFFQWNIDLFGVNAPEADAELISVAANFLQQLRLTPSDVVILVNNRRLLDKELASLGVPASERGNVLRLIDRKDKMNPDKWVSFALESGLSIDQLEDITALLADDTLWKKSEELVRCFDTIDSLGFSDYVQFAPYIVRGLDYYTGIVFECYDINREFRAILGGGRYDNLLTDVGGTPLPGTGFAMGDKVITAVLESKGKLPPQNSLSLAPVFITVFSEETKRDSQKLAAELRSKQIATAVYPQVSKLGKQFKYADRTGSNIVIVLGPDEIKDRKVSIKNLVNRTQTTIDRDMAVPIIIEMLERKTSS